MIYSAMDQMGSFITSNKNNIDTEGNTGNLTIFELELILLIKFSKVFQYSYYISFLN